MRIVVGIVAATMAAGTLIAAPASADQAASPAASQVTPRKALLTTKEIQKASGTKANLARMETTDLTNPSTCSDGWCMRSYLSNGSLADYHPFRVEVKLNVDAETSVSGVQITEDNMWEGSTMVARTPTSIAVWTPLNDQELSGSLLYYRARGKWSVLVQVQRDFVYNKPAKWQEALKMAMKIESAQYKKIAKLSGGS